jgi:hypothetical protein
MMAKDSFNINLVNLPSFGFHKTVGNFLTSCKDWLASQEGLCSMEYVSK